MTIATYTYPADGSREPEHGLSALDVARERLGHDGHDYEMRREDGGWQLYASRGSRNSFGGNRGLVAAYADGEILFSAAATENDAWAELAPKVALADWPSVPDAMTDASYREMLEGLAADAEAAGDDDEARAHREALARMPA